MVEKTATLPLVLALALALALALPPAPALRAQNLPLDSVVAIVEDEVIMFSELQGRIAMLQASFASRGQPMPPQEILVRETLDRLILESIQLQMGRRVGVQVSDEQINAALGSIARQQGMSIAQFRQRLEAEGGSFRQMREDIREEIIIQRVQAGNISQRIQISDEEADNFLESPEGRGLLAEEYRLSHALLPIASEASPEEEALFKAHIDQLHQRIQGGEDFDAVISGSGGQFTFEGGDLGWRTGEDVPSLFAELVPTLEPGQTTEPLRSPSGFHLLHLRETRGGSIIAPQTKVRHILLKPSEIRTDDETRELAADLRRQVLEGADFGELARAYSEDVGTAQEGGELGWANPGQMVPEFENIMDSTSIDGVSQPFQTPFGWHILQVLERRQEDVSLIVARNRAREILHKRKYQEELDAWLRKIRDEAFVDIK